MPVVVTPDEMRAAEQAAVHAGRPEPDLMRAAAEAIAAWVDARITAHPSRPRVAIGLVGPGNNGGDALVTLGLLVERGWECRAVLVDRHEIGTLPLRDELLQRVSHSQLAAMRQADVVLDGIYGIGGRAELSSAARSAIAEAYDCRSDQGTPLVAIDIPSGVDALTGAAAKDGLRADTTLCLGLPKIGLLRAPAMDHVGELELLDIDVDPVGSSLGVETIDARFVQRVLPRRGATAHKSSVGSVLVVGGAPNYFGAPRLAGEAAARCGAGLVSFAVPASIVATIAGQFPEATFAPLPEADPDAAVSALGEYLERQQGRFTACVLGPGLGTGAVARRLVEATLIHEGEIRDALGDMPVVVDADGLNLLAQFDNWPRTVAQRRLVLTPHPGEMGRLTNKPPVRLLADPFATARTVAEDWGQTIIFKTGYSPVAHPDAPLLVSPRACPELATAGTGDVLAGLTGGLLCQGLAPRDAAAAAVYIGAHAGKAARAEFGTHGVLARDVIARVPAIIKSLAEANWRSHVRAEDALGQ